MSIEPKTPAPAHLRGNNFVEPNALVSTWRTVRKYWRTALGTAAAVALTVAFYTLGQTKIYQAVGTVMFDPNPPRPLGKDVDTVVDMGSGSFWNNQEYYTTQYKVMQSMRVALGVVQQLDLNHDAAFLKGMLSGTRLPQVSVPPEQAAEIVRRHLTVEPVRESRLATVRYEDPDPKRAQTILSALIDLYIDQNLEDALTSTNSAVDWLRGQSEKLRTDLESSEMALHDYKLRNNILSVAYDDQSNMLREEIKQLNDALTSVRTKREEIAARRGELHKVSADDPSNLPASELLQSILLQGLRQAYGGAVRDRDSLLGEGKGHNHPDVMAADARVNASREALLAEVRNIKGALDRDLAVVSREEGGLAGLVQAAKKQALDLNLLEIEYARLHRSKENNEKLYQLVLERTKESDLARMLRVNNVKVLDRPLMPGVPVRPRVAVNIVLGTLLGVLFGIGAATARALLDRTLKTPDDIERELGLPFLGLIPEIEEDSARSMGYRRGRRRRRAPGKVNRELIVHDFPMSGIAEASRAIRTNLMFMAPDNPYKLLLITSAGPSEGKTTVACCIAIAMAQAGQRVALIDCDLRRPRMHRVFHKSPEIGVTTALLDQSLLSDEAMATEVPNLFVLPAGPIPPNPSEILHSAKFRELLDALLQRFDRVIIDSPPIIAVTDAAILSTLVDGTVLVARAFTTAKEVSRQALRALVDVGGKTAGAILNSVDLDRHEYKYYYYYYKKDAYYASTPSTPGAGSEATPPPAA